MLKEIYQDKLRVIASDEFMLAAIREVIEKKIKANKPVIVDTDDDNVLGQKYRASKEAENIIEDALIEISSYKEQFKNNLIYKEK